jgi:magnesium-transporting ATPase (P-type)
VQLLWINLIMDSFAALMLATEPPSDKLMLQRPQGKDEPLITATMTKNMVGHAIFQTALLLWLTMTTSGSNFFELDYESSSDLVDKQLQVRENTLVFNVFVSLQIFNLFNCRAVHDEWNVFENFTNSTVAQVVLVIIAAGQWFIVQFGGSVMQTSPLTGEEWAKCLALGALSLPVGYLLKLVPVAGEEVRSMQRPARFGAAEGEGERAGAGAAEDEEPAPVASKPAGARRRAQA